MGELVSGVLGDPEEPADIAKPVDTKSGFEQIEEHYRQRVKAVKDFINIILSNDDLSVASRYAEYLMVRRPDKYANRQAALKDAERSIGKRDDDTVLKDLSVEAEKFRDHTLPMYEAREKARLASTTGGES